MLKSVLWSGLTLVLFAASACGSDDGKKKSQPEPEAGAGGEDVGAGGSAAGEPAGGVGGNAGEPSEGGAGGIAEGGMGGLPVAGEAGAPSVPEPELLFSVKSGANGLAGTALRARSDEGTEGTAIYTSRTGSQEGPDGTNAVKVTGEQLGLDPSTTIVAFAEAQAEPTAPLYLFSVAPGTTGGQPTQVYDRFQEFGDEASSLLFSDGIPSRRAGPVDDELGYNGLLARTTTLGLAIEGETTLDDLVGLVARDARTPLTELYFTVGTNALGAPGTPLSLLDPYEAGCTLFRSRLDGTHEVALTCAELGLAAGDRVDGLIVLANGGEQRVLFSVSAGSLGAPGSAVEAKGIAGGALGATVFASLGTGSNALYLAATDLGLADGFEQEIDGLTLTEAPPPSVEHAATCDLSLEPVGAAGVSSLGGVAYLADKTLIVFGPVGENARALAYDVDTCQHLQTKDLAGTAFQYPTAVAIAKRPGWNAATPLDEIEYFRLGSSASNLSLDRYTAAGEFVVGLPITGTYAGEGVDALVYDATGDGFIALTGYASYDLTMVRFPRPAEDATSIEAVFSGMDMPCSSEGRVTGVDAAGTLYVAQRGTAEGYRVCAVSPAGLLRPAPYFWSSQTTGTGLIVPGGAHYLFSVGGASSIERGDFQN